MRKSRNVDKIKPIVPGDGLAVEGKEKKGTQE